MLIFAINRITLGKCESDICSTLTEAGAVHMLQVSRSPGQDLSKTHSDAPKDGSQTYPLHCEYPFIPELLFALFMSVYQSPGELSRVLQQDWINDWNGWKEAQTHVTYRMMMQSTRMQKSL